MQIRCLKSSVLGFLYSGRLQGCFGTGVEGFVSGISGRVLLQSPFMLLRLVLRFGGSVLQTGGITL